MPLNSRLGGRVELERAINRGTPACPDLHRHDFYDVELDHGRAYVHVRDDLRTVYLVAYFGSISSISSLGETVRTVNRERGVD
ncbi:MAG TPA: hypothetical protein VE422_27865 [Terriglobia bacterium]|nr:hypothetical protein [Terriglobia bacterium]